MILSFYYIRFLLTQVTFSPFTKVKLAYRMDDTGFKSWQKQDISFFSKSSRLDMGPTKLSIQWVPGTIFPGGWGGGGLRQSGCGMMLITDLPPFGAVIKNEWSYNPAFPIYLRIVDRDKFAFTFTILIKSNP